ncbi:EcoKI restriction-modification system protein HsdS [compost metagenome]
MSSKNKTTATKDDARHALVPKLRFPEFRDAGDWESGKVDDLVDTVTPPKKLPTSTYASSGAFPIIDQSQSDICGWTDDEEALIQEGLPLVIFGDHTCILKLINRPFAQGADGIKILKARPKVGTPYLYQFLSYQPVVTEEYKRHYSILKEKSVFFPDFKSGEQQKIAECLSSVDELMAAQARKVDALKTHKKGLMQQLFPRAGETRPRLRFPEFQNSEDWDFKPFEEFVTKSFYGTSRSTSPTGRYPVLRMGNMLDGGLDFTNLVYLDLDADSFESFRLEEGDILLNRTNSPALVGKISLFQLKSECMTASYIVTYRLNKKRIDPSYCNLMLNTPIYQARIRSFAKPSVSQANINPTTFKKELIVSVPSLAEQQRIALHLNGLDTLIAAETQKLEALKTHKKGLMQQLFPSLEEEQ